jgi:hypothetical protein
MAEPEQLSVTPEQAMLQGSEAAALQAVDIYSDEIAAIAREVSTTRIAIKGVLGSVVNIEFADPQDEVATLDVINIFVSRAAKRSFQDGFQHGVAFNENQERR